MIYLDNNTQQQECWIPRQDVLAGHSSGKTQLEGKTVVISADTTYVYPSSGYVGMSAVTVDAEAYAQENYDSGFDDGFNDGISSGYTEGYDSGFTSGHSQGMADQKALLSTTALTENGEYSRENGWSGVTVNIDTASTYNSGYTSGYTSGHTDGVSEEKAKMSAVTFTANTAVTLSDGSYSAVTVDVPQTGTSIPLTSIYIIENTAITVSDVAYTGITVNVNTADTYNRGYSDGYSRGTSDGESTIISTFTSMTATTNGEYGSSAHPLSSITVSVPTGSSINIEQNKSLTATTNGVYNINPSYIWQITYDDHMARRYDFTINGTIPQSEVGRRAFNVSYYDENTGEEPSVSVTIGSGNTLYLNKNGWDEDDYGRVYFVLFQGKYKLEFDQRLDWSQFSILAEDDGVQYDAMSSVTIDVNVPKIVFADYIHTETLSANTYEDYIDTGLYPTTGITFRVKGYRMYENGQRIVGWSPDETTHSDDNDFRLFWAGGETVYFDWGPDWNGGRINAHYFNSVSGYTDITCGNYYVYDNVGEQMICSGSVKSLDGLYQYGSIRVDVGSWWLKSLEIYDGNTLLFSGTAAYDTNGNVGLFDSVSQTLKTAITNQQMVYEYSPENVPDVDSIVQRTITSYSASPNVTTIGNYAFAYCTSLTSVTLTNNITNIGIQAFGDTAISEITIPNSITSLGINCFIRCASLSSVTLNDRMTRISSSCFSDCPSLHHITLPSGCTVIEGGAFYNSGLEEITFPATLREISYGAFGYCGSLNEIYSYPTTVPTIWNPREFNSVAQTGTLHYPIGSDYSGMIAMLPSGWTAIADL